MRSPAFHEPLPERRQGRIGPPTRLFCRFPNFEHSDKSEREHTGERAEDSRDAGLKAVQQTITKLPDEILSGQDI